MQAKFGEQGLTVLGVTDEPQKPTETWVEKKGAKYAYAYDKGGKLARFFGVSGIPHAVLVDATGKIVWRGNPGRLEDAVIEKAVKGALSKPMWDWPASAKAVRTAVQKRQWAEAISAASKLAEADGGPVIADALKQLVTGRVTAMKEDLNAGNFLGAQDAANALSKSLGSLPEKAEADAVLTAIKADKDAATIIKAQQQIRGIREAAPSKRKEIDAAIDDLKKLVKEHPGTFAATEANAMLDELMEKKRNK
ncbi:MAG: TlpA family protein disulfide reductase [Planctomycetes bacterium]|nr:TlpA family protein disulfide reductase [Planctomycetota bacterium]